MFLPSPHLLWIESSSCMALQPPYAQYPVKAPVDIRERTYNISQFFLHLGSVCSLICCGEGHDIAHIDVRDLLAKKKKSLLSPGFQGQNSDCWAQQQMTFLLSYFAYVTLTHHSSVPRYPRQIAVH